VPNFVYAETLTNLALNQTASSGKDSCSGNENAAKAVDGDGGNGSKWCYKTGVDWLQVDLGANYNVSEFIVKNNTEQNNYITSAYNIKISTDNITWTNVVSVTNNTAAVVTSNIAQAMARYVKLDVITPTQDGSLIVRINEFEVYGNPTALVNAATPSIDLQPIGVTVNKGEGNPVLSVSASVYGQDEGNMLSYQWYSHTMNANNGGSAINGATSTSYTAPTNEAGTKYYYVVVTNTNSGVTGIQTATATSDVAIVHVNGFPSGSFTIAGGAAINTTAVSLAITRSSTDVVKMRFSDDGQAWPEDWDDFSETKLYTMPSGDGLKMIYMELQNTANNVNIDVITNSIILDTLAPDAPVLTLSSTGPTQEVTVTIAYSPDTTVKQYQISGDSLALYTGPFVLTENKTISAYATDAAGNQKEAVFDITNIDNEAPVTTSDISIDSTTNYVTIHLSAADNGADHVTSYYTVDGVEHTGDLIFLNKQGIHHITYWSIDAVGNIETTNSREVKVEILKMNSDGQFTIEDIVKLIHQGTIQQLDMNGDSMFDKKDIQVMLKTITPIYH
jgi:hypothetical protein